MRKLLIIVNLLIISLTGCVGEQVNFQLNLLDHPAQITPDNQFTVKGEYLTKKPGAESVKVNLTVRKIENKAGILTKEKSFSNQSQVISFSSLTLDESTSFLEGGVYFELKLIVDGEFIRQVTTKSRPTLIANWHREVITTYFRPAYYDDGEEKLTSFGTKLSEENPYYFALPYRPYYQGQVYKNNPDLYGTVKNRWIKIYYPYEQAEHNYVYAQWEDVGPWNVYDPYYVFGTNKDRPYAETGIDMGWTGTVRETNKAGLDISPAAMSHLTGGTIEFPDKGKIKVDWRFVEAEEVPQGPWSKTVSNKLGIFKKSNYQTNTLETSQ